MGWKQRMRNALKWPHPVGVVDKSRPKPGLDDDGIIGPGHPCWVIMLRDADDNTFEITGEGGVATLHHCNERMAGTLAAVIAETVGMPGAFGVQVKECNHRIEMVRSTGFLATPRTRPEGTQS